MITNRTNSGLLSRLISALILVAPAVVLGIAAYRTDTGLLTVGTVAELLGGMLFVRHKKVWRPPASGSVILLYLMGLAWLWFATQNNADTYARFGRGFLLLAAVALVIGHDLVRTGLQPRRKAQILCRKLLSRTRWPVHASAYAELSEVRALQYALRDDPGPAMSLLDDPRAEVRLSAFLALQGREYWRLGESAAVLTAARTTIEPTVRAAAVLALASANDLDTIAAVAGYLHDPAPEVREAAAIALVAGGGSRWAIVRDYLRDALADPMRSSDGALPGAAGRLPPMAICDLTVWAGEQEPLAERSVLTLLRHYAASLRAGDQLELPAELGRQVIDPKTPPALRLELAALLRGAGMIPLDLLDRMSDADQPGTIRLMAAEILLTADPNSPDALDVLRGLGRQANRESVLTIAKLLQVHQGLDMGLPDGPIAANSKAAAEAARRVFQWATGRTPPPKDLSKEAGSAWVTRPVSRPALPSLKATAPQRIKPIVQIDSSGSGSIWTPK